jgi:hypothetical protein
MRRLTVPPRLAREAPLVSIPAAPFRWGFSFALKSRRKKPVGAPIRRGGLSRCPGGCLTQINARTPGRCIMAR